MSAMPDNILQFELPAKPRLKLGEPLPDQRKICIVPIRVIKDKRVTLGMVKALMLMCSYANRAGITWVGQKRLAQDAGISQQAISRQVVKLTKLGYLEIIRKGKPGDWMTTWRIVYDEQITAQDAITNTSNKEDNRSPTQILDEEKRLQEEANQKDINEIQNLIYQSITREQKLIKKEYQMPQDNPTITVKQMKADIAKKKTKSTPKKAVDKSVDKPVDNLVKKQHPEVVDLTTEKGCVDLGFNNNIYNLVMNNIQLKSISKSVIKSKLELLLPAYQAEGIQPSELALVDGILHMVATDARSNAV
jgi:hypothetical protein